MADTKQSTNRSPYPSLAEAFRFLAQALDTRSVADEEATKRLDRMVAEGEYDWSLPEELLECLMRKPLEQRVDAEFAEFVAGHLKRAQTEYLCLVSRVALDALTRDEALPILAESLFSFELADFLLAMSDRFGGPSAVDLLRSDDGPIDAMFEWIKSEARSGEEINRTLYPLSGTERYKELRDQLSAWRKGAALPNLPSIVLVVSRIRDRLPGLGGKCQNIHRWLVVARALAYFDRETGNRGELLSHVMRHLLSGRQSLDIGNILSLINVKAGQALGDLWPSGLLLMEGLKRTTNKPPGSQARTRDLLDQFAELRAHTDPDDRTKYLQEWMAGRWYVLSGRPNKALPFYERAVHLSAYRAGESHKAIVEETVALAASLGSQKPLIKRLKNHAIVFGWFSENGLGNEVVESWEQDALQGEFESLFPRSGCFAEAKTSPVLGRLPMLVITPEEVDRHPVDLRNPDRRFTIRFADGQTRRCPQLAWFASHGCAEEVRKLLDHGADVNMLDSTGGSALLLSIQRAEDQGDRSTLNLLLEQPHSRNTLNHLTDKRRLGPLHHAVILGDPEVVKRLLDMGCDADVRGDIGNETPLYRCAEQFGFMRSPDRMADMMQEPLQGNSIHTKEIVRRYTPALGGIWGDVPEQCLASERDRELLAAIADVESENVARRYSEEGLTEICRLLLSHGADPNARHDHVVRGRTPLMVAAEVDAAGAVEVMLMHGGEVGLVDDGGYNTWQIAIGFSAANVLKVLRKSAGAYS